MKYIKQALLHYFEGVPDQVRRYRWLMWALIIGITAFAMAGIPRTKFDMTIEGWFSETDPTIVAMNDFRSRFGSDDHLYIVYKPKDGNVFSAKSLEVARAIRLDLLNRMVEAKEGSPLKRIVKITALPNAPVLRVEEDALVSRNLVPPKIPTEEDKLKEIARIAHTQRSLPLQYFSKDHKYGGILVETNFGAIPADFEGSSQSVKKKEGGEGNVDNLSLKFEGEEEKKVVRFKPTDLAEYMRFMNEVKVTLNKPEFAGHFEYHPVGNSASTEYNMKTLEEMGALYGAMLLIMVVVLWFVFRSVVGVLWPSLIVILSAIWTVGIAGWLGLPFTAFLVLTVAMILVIGISDSIHILSGYQHFRALGQDKHAAMRSSFHSSANACFLTATTGMIGILSVVFTPIVPIQVQAVTTAAGIGFAFLLSIYFMPLLVDLWWPEPKKAVEGEARSGGLLPNMAESVRRFLPKVLPFVEKNRNLVIAIGMSAFVTCLYGMSQIHVDTNPKALFPHDAKIRTDMDVADQNMMGSQTMEVFLDFGAEYAMHDPFVLKRMDDLQRKIETKYSKYVVRTLSLVDVAKSSYQVLNEDREEMFKVADSRQAVANTLFLFDNSNPGQRRKMVSDDFSKAHITIYLRNGGSYEYTKVFQDMQSDINQMKTDIQQQYPKTIASVTGLFTLVMQGSDYLSWNALSSFGWAVVTISVILLIIFGSMKAGLVSVLANAVPVILTFGLMGLMNVPLDFTTVLIAPIVIGLAVDDTVHFVTHFRQEMAAGCDQREALKNTIMEAGQSVTYTSLILTLGLSVLAFSSSPGNANVGIYGALAVVVGWICELTLTPALIMALNLKFNKT